MSGFENQQFLCPGESEGRKLTVLSNGMCTITLGFEFQYRGNHLKNTWVTCEGGPLTNIRARARMAGICCNVLQGQMHYGYHSTLPRVGGCHFWHSVSTMLEHHSPPTVFPCKFAPPKPPPNLYPLPSVSAPWYSLWVPLASIRVPPMQPSTPALGTGSLS